jgi:hypothetical protein
MAFRLFAVSFVSLFWEVLLIRWIPSELPFLAFFRSLVILACFLGLGMGCLAYSRVKLGDGPLVLIFITGVLIAGAIISLGGPELRARGFDKYSGILQQEHENVEAQRDQPSKVDFTLEFEGKKSGGALIVICTFVLVSLIFAPIGIMMARCFTGLDPIPAYLINILGALAGTLVFVGLSIMMLSPPYWFMIGLAACLLIVPRGRLWRTTCFALAALLIAVIFYQNRSPNIVWSPYQRVAWRLQYINLEDFPFVSRKKVLMQGPIFVNHEYHQCMMDYGFTNNPQTMEEVLNAFGEKLTRRFDTPVSFYKRYNTPYCFVNPKNVLIIAAGNGNEAAAALRAGVAEIDAVEIDPGIIDVGRKFHPEKPYSDPRVNVICDDARAFLNHTDKKYDLIVMNAVDSHSQFASSAGLRLDSYIYTVEFFEQVRRHLSQNGLFAMEFSGFHWNLQWSRERILEILWRVFGYTAPPQMLSGAGGPLLLINASPRPDPSSYNNNVCVSTDDWPQFYMKKPMIPRAYMHIIAYVVFITTMGIFFSNRTSLARVDLHFMFLGAAFMMFEIKSISNFSLLFGATWLANSLVIMIILFSIAAANLIIIRHKDVPYRVGYSIIFLSLIAGIFLPAGKFMGLNMINRSIAAFFIVAVPVFGAGLVFAASFRRAIHPPAALGWNILGAILGGLGEYLSLITGIRALGFYIIALYAISLITLPLSQQKAKYIP